ncbi:uncharacterized protein LOC143251066 isoform X1 [Tachypleus tridentatus]|uniref:uncharacterized protein LOC143251066 isoform X1 n=1 Tax=Tachypleus tridentatus TaxID=6853 RepID=UPI003FD02E79
MRILLAVVVAYVALVLCSCIRTGICAKRMLKPIGFVVSPRDAFHNISGRAKTPHEKPYTPLHNFVNKNVLTDAIQTAMDVSEQTSDIHMSGEVTTPKTSSIKKANFNENCQRNDQCGWMTGGDLPLQCLSERCDCPFGYIFVERPYVNPGCYRKAMLFGNCQVNEQCTTSNTLCSGNGKCLCGFEYYFRYGEGCIKNSLDSKVKHVYTAAMISAACLMIAIFGILLTCIIRRSFSGRQTNTEQGNSRINEVFTISDEMGAIRALDKPPTYDEVIKREREVLGIPPPEYADTVIAGQIDPSLQSCNNLERQPRNHGSNSTTTTELKDSMVTIGNQNSNSTSELTNLEGESATNTFITHMSITSYGESDQQQQEHISPVESATDTIPKDNVVDVEVGPTSRPSTSYVKYYDNPIFPSQ